MISARCLNHSERFAAARCLSCGSSYCRECVTEHQGRMTCAACMKRLPATKVSTGNWRKQLTAPLLAIVALFGCWIFFFTAGWILEEATAPPRAAAPVKSVVK